MFKRICFARHTPHQSAAFCLIAAAALALNTVIPAIAEEVVRIDALNVHADPAKLLKSITVLKTNAPSYMVFWGATGVAPNVIPVRERPDAIHTSSGLFGSTRITGADDCLRFVNLPANTEIGLFSVTGRLAAHCVAAHAGAFNWTPAANLTAGAYLCVLRSGTTMRNIEVFTGE
jgi:hypothetical protein